MSFNKPYKTISEQIEILKKRGLHIPDEDRARRWLQKTGYYRLSAYWHPLLDSTSAPNIKFLPNTSIEEAFNIYVFDKHLRLFVLDAIERIEVALRVDIALLMGAIDPYSYLNPNMLDGNFSQKLLPYINITKHDRWMQKLARSLEQSSEEFITTFKTQYPKDKLPIWMAIELWDFGMLSNFYEGMRHPDKTVIAQKYQVNDPVVFVSWLKLINYIRNICAHHARLWNKAMVLRPKWPSPNPHPILGQITPTHRIYDALVVLQYFSKHYNPHSSWNTRLMALLDTFPHSANIKLSDTGIPDDWYDKTIWN